MITVDVIKDPNGDGKFDFVLKGLSTDNKPIEKFGGNAIADNSLFEELDTGDKYYYNEGEWHKMSSGGGGGTLTPKFGFMQINGVNVKALSEYYDAGAVYLEMENGEFWTVEGGVDLETGDYFLKYHTDDDPNYVNIENFVVGSLDVDYTKVYSLQAGIACIAMYEEAPSE